MSVELRDRGAAEDWLRAGFCLTRLEVPSAAHVGRAAPWVLAAQEECGALPPVGVIADLGRLLTGGTRDVSHTAIHVPDGRLRSMVRLYEDQVLGRLASDSNLEAASDAIARLPVEARPQAIAIAVSALLERMRFGEGVSVSPGITRALVKHPSVEMLQAGYERLGLAGELAETLADGYESLVRAARHAPSLIAEADVFALENLTVLKTLTQRLSVQQVAEAAEELGKGLPRRIKKKAGGSRAPTNLEDDDQYPIGGFSSISTAGSIENLVSSELIYMEEEAKKGEAQDAETDDVDLFDMRYVEGELLYYTRDESVFVRNHRVITFALDSGLLRARFKDANVRWQRLVIAQGVVLCLVRRITDWLSDEGLTFRVIFVRDERGAHPLAQEKSLAEILLREWIEKGTAEIGEAASLAEVMAGCTEKARRAQSDLVVFAAGGATPLPVDARVQVLAVDLAAPRPWDEWADLVSSLAHALV